MSLDFGTEKRWTESKFVLIDGEKADFQPNVAFHSIPSVNFHWLASENVVLNLPKIKTTTGLFIFNSASNVNLYFNDEEINGLK